MSSYGSSISCPSSEELRSSRPRPTNVTQAVASTKSEQRARSAQTENSTIIKATALDDPRFARHTTGLHEIPPETSSQAPAMTCHVPPLRRHASDGRNPHIQPWSQLSTNGPPAIGLNSALFEARRMNLLALDRKRRLTDTAQDSGRRRTMSGGFRSRPSNQQSSPIDGPPFPNRRVWPERTASRDQAQNRSCLDLTSSSPPGPPLRSYITSSQMSTPTSGQHVLPRWQPDMEATECPICKRPFTWIFRRHHCRKCGRVVCNDCSPHRITIPRQFIVHPPGIGNQTATVKSGFKRQSVTVSLPEEFPFVPDAASTRPPTRTLPRSQPGLGGGDKVRLCNPCVPDPQPSPDLGPHTTDVILGVSNSPIPHPLNPEQLEGVQGMRRDPVGSTNVRIIHSLCWHLIYMLPSHDQVLSVTMQSSPAGQMSTTGMIT